MKKTLAALALVAIALAAYFALWPLPVEPVGWPAPPAPGYTGPHAVNQGLARLQHIDLKGEAGPEHVAIGPDGKLYTAVDGGNILRMNPDGSGQEVFARTGGRVLGFDFDAAGNLIGADAFRGLVSIAADGKVTVLADKVDGDPIRFADAVAVARNGRSTSAMRRPVSAPGKAAGSWKRACWNSLSSPPPAECWSGTRPRRRRG